MATPRYFLFYSVGKNIIIIIIFLFSWAVSVSFHNLFLKKGKKFITRIRHCKNRRNGVIIVNRDSSRNERVVRARLGKSKMGVALSYSNPLKCGENKQKRNDIIKHADIRQLSFLLCVCVAIAENGRSITHSRHIVL